MTTPVEQTPEWHEEHEHRYHKDPTTGIVACSICERAELIRKANADYESKCQKGSCAIGGCGGASGPDACGGCCYCRGGCELEYEASQLCICDKNPATTDGPSIECPIHGLPVPAAIAALDQEAIDEDRNSRMRSGGAVGETRGGGERLRSEF